MMFTLLRICLGVQTAIAAIVNPRVTSNLDLSETKIQFEQTLERYPTPYGVLRQIARIAPQMAGYDDCEELTINSAPVLGTIDPMFGPLELVPGDLFYPYFQNCVRQRVDRAFAYNVNFRFATGFILGPEMLSRIKSALEEVCASRLATERRCAVGPDLVYDFYRNEAWANFPSRLRLQIIERYLLYLVGPEPVLRAEGYLGSENVFAQNLESVRALAELLDQAVLNTRHADGKPLTPSEVYAEIAILIKLGPALKS